MLSENGHPSEGEEEGQDEPAQESRDYTGDDG